MKVGVAGSARGLRREHHGEHHRHPLQGRRRRPAVAANAADGADYTGELQGNAQIRITDHWNAVAPGGGPDAATVIDIPFPVNATCARHGQHGNRRHVRRQHDGERGRAGTPVKDSKRANVEIGQVQITDGGPDGVVGTAPNTLFASRESSSRSQA